MSDDSDLDVDVDAVCAYGSSELYDQLNQHQKERFGEKEQGDEAPE